MKNILILISFFILNASDCKSKKAAEKNADNIPECIQEKIAIFTSEKVANPPIKVYSYTYNSETVYYVSAVCCDVYSELYDKDCNRICAPDGGKTGRGDGKCKDFFDSKTDEKLIWSDSRKYGRVK